MQLASALEQVRKTTAFIQPLDENVWTDFSAIWQPFSAKRKTVLTALDKASEV